MDYEQFFGLKDTPFRLTPDPDYYFPSDVHKEALQTLLYSIRAREGFIQITGDPGTGKTLTLRTLLKQLGDEVTTALILNPRLSPEELLKVILEDLGISPIKMEEKSKEDLLRFFRDMLLEKAQKGVTTVLIIDEAQNLPNDTLEELRLLSNLETEKRKLLQIILVGQIELEEKLKSPELKQLDQRITIRYRLKPLSKDDTIAYINHRLRIAGGSDSARFSSDVLKEVYKASRGVPRLINIICERALMAAFVDGKNIIEKPHFKKALESIVGEKAPGRTRTWPAAQPISGVLILALLLAAVVFGFGYQYLVVRPTPEPAAVIPSEQSGIVKGLVTGEGAPKGAAVSSGDPTKTSQAAAEEKPYVPAPPQEAFHVPPDKYFLAVNRERRTAYLWQGHDPAPVLKAEFKWNQPLPDGLYVVGENINKRQFFFNYPHFFWRSPKLPDETVWTQVSQKIDMNLIPLISHADRSLMKPSQLERAREIRHIIKIWAEAWRNKEIDKLMSFYANIFTTYYDDRDKPSVYTKEQLYKLKQDVFLRSGPISLTLSDPMCFIDPGNPELLMAVFYQKYVSQIYSDEGMKVKFFSLVEDEKGKRNWKIVAKLWVPLVKGGEEG